VFAGLVSSLYRYVVERGYTHLYISGVEKRQGLYEELGFEPLGPAVVSGGARFVPMAATPDRIAACNAHRLELWRRRLARLADGAGQPVSLLPGPVPVAEAVRAAFHRPPLYHRGPEFLALFGRVRRSLGRLVAGREVALFHGSGTLANEVVASTLAAGRQPGRGVLLVNGEFGRRLERQAARFGLRPRVLTWPWGRPWDLDEVAAALSEEPTGSWVWGVHHESSTGVLNDLPGLVRLAGRRDLRVCADCVSSLGAVPLDLQGVTLATGSSGKALGAYAGIAVVFADPAAVAGLDPAGVPSYLDLAAALENPGPQYTFPSPALCALAAALDEYTEPGRAEARYARYERLGRFVRRRLRAVGIEPLADEGHASPVLTTFAPPDGESSTQFVGRCAAAGFLVGGESSYLAERRLAQVATMGAVTEEEVASLFKSVGCMSVHLSPVH
jgi:aspartate aminotransferase-like enzyme